MRNTAICLLGFFCMATLQLNAQSVDEIINQHIEANGGLKKLSELKTVRFQGSIETEEFEIGIRMSIAHKKGVRVDMHIAETDNVQFANTQTGYSQLPAFGLDELREMTPEELAVFQVQMDLESPLINYQEKGHSIENGGTVELGGALAYKLDLQYEDGNRTTFFIDKESGYLLKQVQYFVIDGQDLTIENSFSDYRKNDSGFIFPYTTTSELGTVTFSKIETNITLEDKLFEK